MYFIWSKPYKTVIYIKLTSFDAEICVEQEKSHIFNNKWVVPIGIAHFQNKKSCRRNQMVFKLVPVEPGEIRQYKLDMQEAFQKGFENVFGKTDAIILPEKDIDQSVNAEGSAVYKAVVDGEMVGGAVVIINESTQHNHLDLLFVKNGVQSNGIGKKIWFELERIYPNTKVWETCTPYFDKRNIHFYVNVCGFHITEFFNEKHPMPDTPEDFVGDGNEGMFAFKKQMRK